MKNAIQRSMQIFPLLLVISFCSDAWAGPKFRIGRLGASIAKGASATGKANNGNSLEYQGQIVLTIDELRQCIVQEIRLTQFSERIDKLDAALQSSKSTIQILESHIRYSEVTIDRYSDNSVNSHNALIADHRLQVREFNESVNQFNTIVSNFRLESASFNLNCSGKSYYDSDMAAARNSLK